MFHHGKGWTLLAQSHSMTLVFPDNTANVTVKYGQFDRERAKVHYLPILISDNGKPSLTSTNVLAVAVCKCNEWGEFTFCEEAAAQMGVSIQALVAIFLCILTITGQCPGAGEEKLREVHRCQGPGLSPASSPQGSLGQCTPPPQGLKFPSAELDAEFHPPGY